jgi:hypothetical protein
MYFCVHIFMVKLQHPGRPSSENNNIHHTKLTLVPMKCACRPNLCPSLRYISTNGQIWRLTKLLHHPEAAEKFTNLLTLQHVSRNLPSNHSTAFQGCVVVALGLIFGCQPTQAHWKNYKLVNRISINVNKSKQKCVYCLKCTRIWFNDSKFEEYHSTPFSI